MVDEKHGVDETRRVSSAQQKPTVSGDVLDVVFLAECSQRLFSQDGRSRRKRPQLQEFVGIWIDGSVPPELLTVDSDHGFVKRDVIRTRVAGGL